MSDTFGIRRTIDSQQHDESDNELLASIINGDEVAMDKLLLRHRERLLRMVQLRMSAQLSARIDAVDVVQESMLHVSSKLEEFVADPKVPFYLWLRKITELKLNELYRQHCGTQKRDAGREIRLGNQQTTAASSVCIANYLAGNLTSPSMGAAKAEIKTILKESLEELEPIDCEIIALHNFEQLSFSECAVVLEVSRSTAGAWYLNAVKRLTDILAKRGVTEMPF